MSRSLIIGLLLAVLIGVGFWFLAASPVLESVADLEAQTEVAAQEESLLLQERNRLRRIQEAELQYLDAVGAIERMVPSTPQQSDLINDLEALADEANVTWLGASFSEPSGDDSALRPVGIAAQIEGQYFELLSYLYAVQDLERILTVESAAFAPSIDEDGRVQLSVALTLTAYTTGELRLPDSVVEEEGN
ncbi:MAG: type 4a pilus biogenesis protein PilO [Acidimicrobiia bacterium]|nr:type 4a pilus biogenesis protein PilO [Acidimicrobiia bacterium]